MEGAGHRWEGVFAREGKQALPWRNPSYLSGARRETIAGGTEQLQVEVTIHRCRLVFAG